MSRAAERLQLVENAAGRPASRTCHMSERGCPCGVPGDSSPLGRAPRVEALGYTPSASSEVSSGVEPSDAAHRVPEVIVEDVTRRIVFLDIDGVLAPIRRWDRYGDLDPACIQVLNEIVARGEADVVVSSTWRHGKTVAELQEILEAEGFTGFVLDKTPTGAPGADRGEEIAAWLAEHAVGGYVIIDDHVDMGEVRTHLVQTHPALGDRKSVG